jgi:hypothetical protein
MLFAKKLPESLVHCHIEFSAAVKWIIIILNLIAAAGLIFLGSFAVAAHRTHAYSVYRELQDKQLLVERPDYSVERRLSTIAGGGRYSSRIAQIAAGLCLMNAVLVAVFWPRLSRCANHQAPSRPEQSSTKLV